MRVFIAIEFDNLIKEYLGEQLQLIKGYINKGNLTNQENFHLTLNFLGEVTPNQIDMLKTAISSATTKQRPFVLKFNKLGQFSRGNTHILWVGIDKSTELEEMYNTLKNSLETYGFPTEKRGLNPHITLGREVNLKVAFEELNHNIHIQPKEVSVNRISLMQSTRINRDLKYIPIYTENLQTD